MHHIMYALCLATWSGNESCSIKITCRNTKPELSWLLLQSQSPSLHYEGWETFRIETYFATILNPEYCHCMQFVLAHFRKQTLHFSFLSAMNAFKVVYFHPGSQNVLLNIIQIYKVHSHNIYPKEAFSSPFPEFNRLCYCIFAAYSEQTYLPDYHYDSVSWSGVEEAVMLLQWLREKFCMSWKSVLSHFQHGLSRLVFLGFQVHCFLTSLGEPVNLVSKAVPRKTLSAPG